MPLVANDKSWAICMPKKTASQSLVGMCEGVAIVVGDWHGCELSSDFLGDRLMIVREPKERLASMFWYSMKEGSFLRGPGLGDEWLERMEQHLSQRKIDTEWALPQSKMAETFKPDHVFKLEDGLQAVLDHVNVCIPHIQYRNVTKDKWYPRKSFADTFTKIPPLVEKWLQDDAGGWY